MPAQRVIRVRRVDADSGTDIAAAYVLVSVESSGPQPLDVKLIGTEGENVFAASIRHKQIRKFCDRKYEGDDREWETILLSTLLQNAVDGDDARHLENVEIVASLSDQKLHIILRKNTQGITQRLGSIPLPEDANTEIEFFEWTAIAVGAAEAAQGEARNLQNKYEAQQVTISKLKSQLDDLIQAKQDHENALLAKFQELLNAKKLKIRDQQRLLAGAKVDPAAAAEVEHARASTRGTRSRKAGPSRASKRKANGKEPVPELESDQDDGSRMQVDEDAGAEREESAEPATPDKSDLDETEDDDDDDEGFDAVPTSRPTKSGEGSKGKAVETVKKQGSAQQRQSSDSLPPQRELPFTKKTNQRQVPNKSAEKEAVPATGDDGDETTDDDEL